MSRALACKRERRGFRRRAFLYAALHAELRSKTSFYAAACLTNHVMSHLVASACSGWLWELGTSLETANVAEAVRLKQGCLAGPQVDEDLVFMEQRIVEGLLQGSPTILLRLNGLLNHDPRLGSLHFSRAVRWYSGVLAEVRAGIDVPLDFARRSHREAIGIQLTRKLRIDSALERLLI